MDDPKRQSPASDLRQDREKVGNKVLGLLLMSAVTVTMTAWIAFLGWAAWSLLGDS
jgi:hypothetical protein